MTERLTISTKKNAEFVNITNQIKKIVSASGVESGICTVYCPHTTGAITINEAADPSVVRDIIKELDVIVPIQHGYEHSEGNSAAHIKSSLIGASETVLIDDGRLVLGTWQGIFFTEFDGPRKRKVEVMIIPSR